ncbi:TIR domain-containing protein, partial [bacterium]|nr:TIR domain-containing protein [bacterium]
VFYDKYNEVDLWGKDLYTHLDAVYRTKGKYCIMFISSAYRAKLWTNHERESAQARAFAESEEYILPVRFDDTEIPGVRPTTGYISARDCTPTELAEKILEKLGTASPASVGSERGFRLPKLTPQTFNPYDELARFIERLHAKQRARAASLVAQGVQFTAFERSGRRCFRLVRGGETEYSLDVWLGDSFNDKSVSFLGSPGEFRPFSSGSNATGEIIWSREKGQPVLKLMDFSLLDHMPSAQEEFTYDEFVDALWNCICDALESSDQ